MNQAMNEREASAIARRLFAYYDRDNSGAIENNEAQAMINDLYRPLTVSKADIDQAEDFIRHNDFNGDGRVTLEDQESSVKKYLCGIDSGNTQKEDEFGIGLTSTLYFNIDKNGDIVANMNMIRKNGAGTDIEVGDYVKTINKSKKRLEKKDLLKELQIKRKDCEIEYELNYAKSLFDTYDKDKSGYIEKEEQPLLQKDILGYELSYQELSKAMFMMDNDGDGKISQEEIEVFVLKSLLNRDG